MYHKDKSGGGGRPLGRYIHVDFPGVIQKGRSDIKYHGAIQNAMERCRMSWGDIKCNGTIQNAMMRYRMSWGDIECHGAIQRVMAQYKCNGAIWNAI